MKVVIDRNGCVSCGTCWDTCPEFFEQNADDSFSQVIEKFRLGNNPAEGSVSSDQAACVTEAADICPAQVITIGE
ncbi:MAG: ferredoxin [Methanoregula sp.]